jgi:hypothetical protein
MWDNKKTSITVGPYKSQISSIRLCPVSTDQWNLTPPCKSNKNMNLYALFDMWVDKTTPPWFTQRFVEVTPKKKSLLGLQALALKTIFKHTLPLEQHYSHDSYASVIPGPGELKAPYNFIHIYTQPLFSPSWECTDKDCFMCCAADDSCTWYTHCSLCCSTGH